MVNKIQFLGTAGDSIVVSKGYRASGGIILNLYGNQFHIDPGPNTISIALQSKIHLRENIVLLVSSPYIINSNDVNITIDAMTHEGFDKKGVLVTSQYIFNNIIGKQQKNNVEKIMILNKARRVGIENVEIEGLKTTNDENLGFKFYTRDITLIYSGITGFDKNIVSQYKDCNILILNLKNFKNKKEHELNIEDVENILKIIQPNLTILTGFGFSMLKADPTFIARDLKIRTGQQVIAAKDGMIIEPDSYSAESRQKSLLGM